MSTLSYAGQAVQTRPPTSSSLVQERAQGDYAAAWGKIIDEKLVELERTPMASDDEFDAPTLKAIQAARRWATDMRDAAQPAPSRVSPDGSGGISFELYDGHNLTHRLAVSDDGNVDHYYFRSDGRVVHSPQPSSF
jgi:hypothetical protein